MTTPLFTEAELRDLVSRDEGQFLEFKSTWDRSGDIPKQVKRRAVRDAIAETVAAFANADGGLLLVGIEDDGSPTGHDYPDEVIEDFVSVPRRRLRPSVSCRADRLRIAGVEVLAFNVPIAPEAVMVTGNGFPYRVGDHVTREPQEVINERKQAYRRVGFEQRLRGDATLDDLDLELAQGFLARTPVGQRPVLEALRYYGLIQHAARDWQVTNAGLLLFAKAPALRWHPRAGLRLFRVAGTSRKHGRQRNVTQVGRADPPLARAIDEAHRLAGQQIRRSERLNGLYFENTPEYPDFAWQETIVNAFAHRDYELQRREVEIWFYEDRMEVSSPGELRSHRSPSPCFQKRRPQRAARRRRGCSPGNRRIGQHPSGGPARRMRLAIRSSCGSWLTLESCATKERALHGSSTMEESLLRRAGRVFCGPEVEMHDGVFTVRLFNEPLAAGADAAPETAGLANTRLASTCSGRFLCASTSFGTQASPTPTTGGFSTSAVIPLPANCDDLSRADSSAVEGKGRSARYLPQTSLK